MNNLLKNLSNLSIENQAKVEYQAVVKRIYESDLSTHKIDCKYLKYFVKLKTPVHKNIKFRLLTLGRTHHDSFTIACFVSAKNIIISNCAILDGHPKGFFMHLKAEPPVCKNSAPSPVSYLPNVDVMVIALSKFNHLNVPYSIQNDPGLAIALGLIESLFQGFWTIYEEYLKAPDEGVTIFDDISGFNGQFGDLYMPGFLEPFKTLPEKMFMAFMIILSIFKPVPRIDVAVIARKKRYDVIRVILGSKLPINQDDKFINIVTMQHLAKYFEKLPKLKYLILSCAASLVRSSKCEPIHEYLLKILIQPDMALFIIIDEFVSMPVKTKAHSHWNVVKEIHRFLCVKKALKNKFGENYYFAKVLEPTTDINVAKWPHLGAVAAMSANIKYPKTNNLKILGLIHDIDFPELLMQEIKPKKSERFDKLAARDSDLFLKTMYGK